MIAMKTFYCAAGYVMMQKDINVFDEDIFQRVHDYFGGPSMISDDVPIVFFPTNLLFRLVFSVLYSILCLFG